MALRGHRHTPFASGIKSFIDVQGFGAHVSVWPIRDGEAGAGGACSALQNHNWRGKTPAHLVEAARTIDEFCGVNPGEFAGTVCSVYRYYSTAQYWR